ncbi:hypothetical protein AMOR_02170 [Anaeromyxobacter oryzae]|uniref:Uncharacterized protein n=1 Tax=Anaeromyxobacter oryzae TaxID=2918170 RepID=A0ABM7WP22_9BACT|nr:hypothetical protein AMOR_02170 [Anaeromyxobacter oryzae]
MLAVALAAAAAPVLVRSDSAARAAEPDVHGTYRLHGKGRVSAGPALDRDEEVFADAVLEPGPGQRDLVVALAAEGHRCELAARLGDGGALALDAGQRCAVTLDGPDARGRVDARLTKGSGRVQGGRLALALAFKVEGKVAVRTGGGRYEVLGNTVDVPATWAPAVPVSGTATATVDGWRDESRAGGER